MTNKFPFITEKQPHIDEVHRLMKKFFSRGAHEKAIEYFGSLEYRNQLVVGGLSGNWRERIEKRPPNNAKLINTQRTELGADVEIEYTPEDTGIEISGMKRIEIVCFDNILKNLREIFKRNGLMERLHRSNYESHPTLIEVIKLLINFLWF